MQAHNFAVHSRMAEVNLGQQIVQGAHYVNRKLATLNVLKAFRPALPFFTKFA